MDQRPPVAMGARTAAGGLTLAVHGLLVTVLLLEDQDLQRPLPASRALAQVWIHLTSVQVPAMDEPLVRETRASRARAIPPRVDESPLARPPATRPSGSIELDRAPSPVHWDLMAQRRAGTFGEEEKPATFGPPVAKLREPCVQQGLDRNTMALMDERLPPPRDFPVNDTRAQKIVQLGGARVGIVTIVGSNRRSVDTGNKSSFKWKWDHNDTGGIAALTLGWEDPPDYDGMFDDMQAGKTPSSSVPDPDFCD
jgi:hypothetical protein